MIFGNEKSNWLKIFLTIVIFIIILATLFYFSQIFNKGSDFDEKKYIKDSLNENGYEVIDVKLEGTSIYAEISTLETRGSSTWTLKK